MQSLILDVKNYDAFRELVEGNMLSPVEGQLPHVPGWPPADRNRMGVHQQSRLSLTTIRGGVELRKAYVPHEAEEGRRHLAPLGCA